MGNAQGRMADLGRPEIMAKALVEALSAQGLMPAQAQSGDWFRAASAVIRRDLMGPWFAAQARAKGEKQVAYLSMEFLMGRVLADCALNIGLHESLAQALESLGTSLETVCHAEPDAALGNGGLGRLAACFMDSLASLHVPATGYGLRYEHGLFAQGFEKGRQVETPETWLNEGAPFLVPRLGREIKVGFGGHVESHSGGSLWCPERYVEARAHDLPVAGWGGNWVNALRLWEARVVPGFDLPRFSRGDHIGAAEAEAEARALTRVLYPDDTSEGGKELRLKQEYLLVAAALADIMDRHRAAGGRVQTLGRYWAIQMNDTHPALAVPELIRLLMDGHAMPFAEAFTLAQSVLSYTNHTLMPEALEAWSTWSMGRILPRHMQIVEMIDQHHARLHPMRAPETAIVGYDKVRMGNLSVIGAHKVNGVSALHTDLMRETVFSAFDRLHPGKIVNETNGVTPRRWIALANPALARLLTGALGDGWQADLERISALEPMLEERAFLDDLRGVKRAAKARFSDWLLREQGISLDPEAMFDVQVKRIHEYKRQLLNILETVALWQGLRDGSIREAAPRVKIFGGKAAPGYHMAKEIIALIHDVGRVINADPLMKGRLKVIYPPNYNVSMAEVLIPSADLSEQISTAGTEASGTGNMKFALNGALTIGTLDGANVEIYERVGAEHFFLFGQTTPEMRAILAVSGHGRRAIEASERLSAVMDAIAHGVFAAGDTARHAGVVHMLWNHDPYGCAADFDAYFAAQRRAEAAFAEPVSWARSAGLNIARNGFFSSDRTIRGYMDDIWGVRSQV